MIKPRPEIKEEDVEDHPKPKPKISLHTWVYQISVVSLLVVIAVSQFVQIYYLRTMPKSGGISDASSPIAVEVINRGLHVEVDNPTGELGTRPLRTMTEKLKLK